MLRGQMDIQTSPTAPPSWRSVLREQYQVDRNRTIAWLAGQTGKSKWTVYAYSRGQLPPTSEWLADASRVLGCEVAA